MEKYEEIEKDLVDLEDVVFRSCKYRAHLKEAVNYRLEIWESKLRSLPLLVKLINYSKIEDMKVRAICLKSIR